MNQSYELHYTQLRSLCSPESFSFKNTSELKPLEGIIGQERAVKAFDFGLAVKMRGYNIYMSGPSGTGKTTYARRSTEAIAATEPVPGDWCYVYNFQDPKRPAALSFPAGEGKRFREDMEKLSAIFKRELTKAFQSEDYTKQERAHQREFDLQLNAIIDEMDAVAAEYRFHIERTDAGIFFVALIDGKPVDDELYETLPREIQEEIDENFQLLQEKTDSFLREIQSLERANEEQRTQLNRKVGMNAIGRPVEQLLERYRENARAAAYIRDVQADVLEHLEEFMEGEEPQADVLSALIPAIYKKQEEDVTDRYRVNLIVDHSESSGAPVVITFNPTYSNLMGEIEYDSEFGNLTTDYMKIKGGLFHQANGGYLIVQSQDILTMPNAWAALRRVIKTREINMDSLRELSCSTALPVLQPEPIPSQIKVIMIGSDYNYAILNEYDEEFHKFFKIRADFDDEMPRTTENIAKIARFIKGFVEREQTLEFDAGAVSAMITYSSRLVARQDKLSTQFNRLSEILGEAHTWATLEQASIITAEHIRKAIFEKEQRLTLYQEKLDEMLTDGTIMIDTTGAKIGQINGLAVLDMGSYAFGTPTRITATTYMGKSGIVNIEKEARMSGQTHDKGVQIITGFLGQTYAQKAPMSLSCRICFEQSYNGIDGDSASSTELYCILSSLADLPIRQDLAVTGSVNQRGEIQAIGGVTHKIEGFFALCKKRGLTGTQGVLIPAANVKDLVLNDEVVDAVRDGLFHIYPISRINEGVELLMQCPAGERDAQGEFPEGTVHGRVSAKLKAFADLSKTTA